MSWLAHTALVALLAAASGGGGDARQIMERVDAAPDGDTRRSVLTMTLTNKSGKTRKRTILSYSKDYPGETKTLMFFKHPADVQGTGFLSYEFDDADREDDRWIYLPALRKVRRISGSSQNDYFMGSDFTYYDLGEGHLDDYTYRLLGEQGCPGGRCWKIESTPVDPRDAGYSKVVSLIRQDALTTVSADFFDLDGRLLKRMAVKDLRLHQGLWTPFSIYMENVQSRHTTLLEMSEVTYDGEVKDSLFKVSSLERGRIQ